MVTWPPCLPCEDQPQLALCPAHVVTRCCVVWSALLGVPPAARGGCEHSWEPVSCDSTEPWGPALSRPPSFPRGGNQGQRSAAPLFPELPVGPRQEKVSSPLAALPRLGLLEGAAQSRGSWKRTGKLAHRDGEAGLLSACAGERFSTRHHGPEPGTAVYVTWVKSLFLS